MKFSFNFKQHFWLCSLALIIGIITHYTFIFFNDKWIVYSQAESFFAKKQWEKAAPIYEKSIAMGVDSPEAILKIAKSYNHMKNLPQSIRWYKAYLNLKPDDFWAQHEYASALTANGNFEEAAKVYQRLLILKEKKL